MAVVLFSIGIASIFLCRCLAKPKVTAGKQESLAMVINRLDRAMASLKEKAVFNEKTKAAHKKSTLSSQTEDGKKGSALSGPLLKGVAKNRGKIKVFLNDQILCVGDELEGCTVVDIKKDGVILRDKDGYESNISLETK